MWTFWRAAIRKCFCFPRSLLLRRPLGSWLAPSATRYPRMSYDPPSLWSAPDQCHPHLVSTSTAVVFSVSSQPAICPLSAVPVDVLHLSSARITTTLPRHTMHLLPDPPQVTSVATHLLCLPAWQHRLLRHLAPCVSFSDCAEQLCPLRPRRSCLLHVMAVLASITRPLGGRSVLILPT